MFIENAGFEPKNQNSIVKPYALTHGTCECYNLQETRRFYEEFLGLECVRHAPPGMVMRCGLKFHIVCIEVGDEVRPCTMSNHWGLDVRTKDEVDEAYQKLIGLKDHYKVKQILEPNMQHGVYSFYFEDLNHNWWEIEHYDGIIHDDFFEFGDQYFDTVLNKTEDSQHKWG
jgi:catechol 2,3-dioxygenase-like lactoylglutathione lyase family enzyme